MDVYICDRDARHTKCLEEMCVRYFVQQNMDSSINTAKNAAELEHILECSKLQGIFLISTEELSDRLVGEIRSYHSQNYIVLMGSDMQKIFTNITPATKPSGCLLKPAQQMQVEKILSEIWEDYGQTENQQDLFHFNIQSVSYTVDCAKICYFESANKKIVLRSQNQQFEFYDSMENIVKKLPGYFMRTHKSFIVNLRQIRNIVYPKMSIYFEDESFVYVSRTYKAELKRRFEEGDF